MSEPSLNSAGETDLEVLARQIASCEDKIAQTRNWRELRKLNEALRNLMWAYNDANTAEARREALEHKPTINIRIA